MEEEMTSGTYIEGFKKKQRFQVSNKVETAVNLTKRVEHITVDVVGRRTGGRKFMQRLSLVAKPDRDLGST